MSDDLVVGVQAALLFEKVDSSGEGCWPWTGARFSQGYGQVRVRGKLRHAHRVVFQTFVADIPDGMVVMHSCDNRICVNPAHLSIGTHADNNRDKANKGRCCPVQGSAHHFAKLSDLDVRSIRESSHSLAWWAKKLGVTRATVQVARVGKTWKHVR